MSHPRARLLGSILAFAAASCGGELVIDPPVDDDDNETFSVGGTIGGSTGDVTLALNTFSESFSGQSFTFSQELLAGSPYAVAFVSSSTGQTCDVTGGIGVITTDVTDVSVSCQDVEPILRYDDAEVTGNLGIGDFDGDGSLDLVFTIRTLPGHAVGTNLDMYRLVFGNGDGSYSLPTDVSRIGSSDSDQRDRKFAVADFNGDGISDFAYSSGQGLEVFEVGPSRTPQRFFGPAPSLEPLSLLDADGNGTQDLLSIVWGGSTLDYFNLFRSNGDGTFAAEEFIGHRDDPEAQALGMGSPRNMTTGDFNGDGHDDIAALVLTGSGPDLSLAVALMSGDGAGGFDYPAALNPVTDDVFEGFFAFENASKELAAGDYDDDGDLDLVLTSTTNFILLLENNGSGSFTESGRVTVRLRPIHVRLADFDGDGNLDIAAANADSNDLVIAFGDGSGGFGGPADGDSAWRVIPVDLDAMLFDMLVADLDGDGTLDIAVAENGTNPPDTGRGAVYIFLAPGL